MFYNNRQYENPAPASLLLLLMPAVLGETMVPKPVASLQMISSG